MFVENPLKMNISADPYHKQVLKIPELCIELSERKFLKTQIMKASFLILLA